MNFVNFMKFEVSFVLFTLVDQFPAMTVMSCLRFYYIQDMKHIFVNEFASYKYVYVILHIKLLHA